MTQPIPEPVVPPTGAPAPVVPPTGGGPDPAGAPEPSGEPAGDRQPTAVEVAALRRENANWRTKLRDKEQADEAFRANLAKALGVPGTEPDPAALTQQLNQAQTDARRHALELAVYRAASPAGVNPDALLDSRSFLTQIEGLDPASADFGTALADALKATGDRFKATQAPPPPARSSSEFSTAPNTATQWTMQDIERATPAQINEAREKGLLKNLLG